MNQRPNDHEAAFHAARKAARRIIATIPETQCTQVFLRAFAGQLAAQPVVTRLIQDDVMHTLPEIQIDLLRHQPDTGLGSLELTVDAMTENLDFTARLVDERSDDAYRGCLAGTVWPK